jgi:hypothetical protein
MPILISVGRCLVPDREENAPQQLAEQTATDGAGPLLQRDYWAKIAGSRFSPEEIIVLLSQQFPRFAPEAIATFAFVQVPPLKVGDEMHIHIRGYGDCHVRVLLMQPRSITLITLEDHYEAGRITFGAWQEGNEIVFKIRSRARVRSRPHVVPFLSGGHVFQKQMWVHFVQNVAQECNAELEVDVHEETEEVRADLADLGETIAPTFEV